MSPLLRYAIVGISTNLIIYAGYLTVTIVGVEPKIAMTVTYAGGAFIGFLGNRKWTFAHNGSATSAALRFVAAHTCGYLLNYSILLMFVDKFGCPHQLVQAASIVFIAAFLFLVFKFWVFRNKDFIRQ